MANIFSRPTAPDVVNGNRFGQNGTNGSSPPSLNGNGQAPVPATLAGRLGHYWQTYAPFRNPFKKTTDGVDDGDIESGVHAITKKTDYWFNRELYTLEQEAKATAKEWADKPWRFFDADSAYVSTASSSARTAARASHTPVGK